LIQEIILFDLETVFKTAAISETLTRSISASDLAPVLFRSNQIPRILHILWLFDERVCGMEESYTSANLLLTSRMYLYFIVVFCLSIAVSSYAGFAIFINFVGCSDNNSFPVLLTVDMTLLEQLLSATNFLTTERPRESLVMSSIEPRDNKIAVPL
jgi:hypothetical protein